MDVCSMGYAVWGMCVCRRVYRLSQLLPSASDEALDLLSCLLQFSAERRLTAYTAIQHSYVQKYVHMTVYLTLASVDDASISCQVPQCTS